MNLAQIFAIQTTPGIDVAMGMPSFGLPGFAQRLDSAWIQGGGPPGESPPQGTSTAEKEDASATPTIEAEQEQDLNLENVANPPIAVVLPISNLLRVPDQIFSLHENLLEFGNQQLDALVSKNSHRAFSVHPEELSTNNSAKVQRDENFRLTEIEPKSTDQSVSVQISGNRIARAGDQFKESFLRWLLPTQLIVAPSENLAQILPAVQNNLIDPPSLPNVTAVVEPIDLPSANPIQNRPELTIQHFPVSESMVNQEAKADAAVHEVQQDSAPSIEVALGQTKVSLESQELQRQTTREIRLAYSAEKVVSPLKHASNALLATVRATEVQDEKPNVSPVERPAESLKKVEAEVPNNLGSLTIAKDVARDETAQPAVRELQNQIEQRIQDIKDLSPGKTLTIRLEPLELGTIEVTVRHSFGKVQADFVVSQETVREMLHSTRSNLADAFTQRGIDLGNMNVSTGSDQQFTNRQETTLEMQRHQNLIRSTSQTLSSPTLTIPTFISASAVDFLV